MFTSQIYHDIISNSENLNGFIYYKGFIYVQQRLAHLHILEVHHDFPPIGHSKTNKIVELISKDFRWEWKCGNLWRNSFTFVIHMHEQKHHIIDHMDYYNHFQFLKVCDHFFLSSHIYKLHGFVPNLCEIYYFIGSFCLNMNVMHYLNVTVMCTTFMCKQHK
jgi:hypothetical protein